MTTEAATRPPRRLWRWIIVLALAIPAGYLLLPRDAPGEAKASAEAPAKKSAAKTVPVVVTPARTGDMHVYLNGLGTATALNTVTVRSRIDGQLTRVLFTEGQYVKQGELLAEIDPRPFQVQLAQAEGQTAKDQAALKNAQLDLQRYQDLDTRGLVPKQQVDTQNAAIGQIEGALRADQAAIDSARLNLAYARITAPIGGRVGLRLVDVGNMVHASDTNGLVVITEVDPIAVVFTIPEDSVQSVLKRMKGGTLTVDAFDRDLKTKLATGTLLTVDNQIDQATGTVKLKAIFPNADGTLFPNQFVNARLLVDTLHDAVVVPAAAIQHGPQSSFVYVVQKDSTVALRNVDVRLIDGDTAAVSSGVTPGDRLVTDGVDKLQPGAKVTIQGGKASKGSGKGGE